MAELQAAKLELELSAGVWTDVWADVSNAAPLHWRLGIQGQRPTDRIAQTGVLEFSLKNGEDNSAGKIGYYTFGHANARSGFQAGVGVRLKLQYAGVWYTKFTGRLKRANPVASAKGRRLVSCLAVDWMDEAAMHKMSLVPIGTNQGSDDVIQTVLANMVKQPTATSLDTGLETFPYAPDNVQDERTTAMAVLNDVVLSEFGYLYVKGDGTLEFQNRHHRVKDTTDKATVTNPHDIDVVHDEELVFNDVRAVIYPRTVGATDELLGEMTSTYEVAAGAEHTVDLRYRDPNNPDVRLAGSALWDAEGKNELANRTMEASVSPWVKASDGTGGSAAQSSTYAKLGTYSAKLTTGTDGTYWLLYSGAMTGFAVGDVLYVQAWVYVPAAWPDGVALYVQEINGSTHLAWQTVESTTVTGGWVRLSGKVTLAQASVNKVAVAVGDISGSFASGPYELYMDEAYLIHDQNLLYEFSTSESGGGDLNTALDLTGSEVGGNSIHFLLHNEGSIPGFVTKLQAKGRAIRTYDPVTKQAEDTASQDAHGRRQLDIPLNYQDQPHRGQDFVDITLAGAKDPTNVVKSVTVHGGVSTAMMEAALSVEPGDRVHLEESVTAINGDYFVNGVEGWVVDGKYPIVKWIPVLAGNEQYWLLGTSQLGIDAALGF